MAAAERAGISREKILLDPGIGFGKTIEHNLRLLADTAALAAIGQPLVVGASRKGFIGKITGESTESGRPFGTAASVAWAVTNGAAVVRVHDVRPMSQVVQHGAGDKQQSGFFYQHATTRVVVIDNDHGQSVRQFLRLLPYPADLSVVAGRYRAAPDRLGRLLGRPVSSRHAWRRMLKGISFVLIFLYLIVRLLSTQFGLERIQFLYGRFLLFASYVVVVVFQPELRRA